MVLNRPLPPKKYGIYRVAFSEAAPVSGVPELVLSKQSIALYYARVMVTWTVQPNPIQLRITVDDILSVFSFANPVSATPYYFQWWDGERALDAQVLGGTPTVMYYVGKIAEGNIKVEVEITGGTVNPLECWLVYQRLV